MIFISSGDVRSRNSMCYVAGAEIAPLVSTLGINIYRVNGNDEISWKLKNIMKKQADKISTMVRQCTMEVPPQTSLILTVEAGFMLQLQHSWIENAPERCRDLAVDEAWRRTG